MRCRLTMTMWNTASATCVDWWVERLFSWWYWSRSHQKMQLNWYCPVSLHGLAPIFLISIFFLSEFCVCFQICGVLAIMLGLFIVVFPLSYHIATLMGSALYSVAGYFLIIAGLAVIVVAFVGCCGAKYENKYLLGVVRWLFDFSYLCLAMCD